MFLRMAFYCLAGLFVFALLGWKLAQANAYESAEYKVLESDSPFEIREYPDLMVAATAMKPNSQSDNGSFMRLFRYISGANDNDQKVAMTTPVFMESEQEKSAGQMGFVLPKEVAEGRVPMPTSEQVQITKRAGGRFAVIRFNGRMNSDLVSNAEASLRKWIQEKGLVGEETIESAGYDPPWTPAKKRRNEVLIRLKPSSDESVQQP